MDYLDEEDSQEKLLLSTLAGLEEEGSSSGGGGSAYPSSSGKSTPFQQQQTEEDYLLDFEFLDDMIRGFEQTPSPPTTPASNNNNNQANELTNSGDSPSVIMPVPFAGKLSAQRRGQELLKNQSYQDALLALKLKLDDLSRTNTEKLRTVSRIVGEGLNVQMRNRSDSSTTPPYPPALARNSPDEEWERLLPSYLADSTGEIRKQAVRMLKLNWLWHKLEEDGDSQWTANDRACLQKLLISQVQQRLTSDALARNKTDMDALTRALQEIEATTPEDCLKLVATANVDWRTISNALRGRHSAVACERMWTLINPGSTRLRSFSEWSAAEKEKLAALMREPAKAEAAGKRKSTAREKSWDEIARGLPGRTPHECFLMWCRQIAPNMAVKERWSAEEDRALLEAVRKYGQDWDRVAMMIPGRNRKQCGLRYTKSLAPQVRRGRWTPEEDAALSSAVEDMGVGSWKQISVRVPGRTDIQCRERWVNVLDTSIRKGVFTKEEDQAILRAVERYGLGRWSQVAQEVPGRTDNQCWRRHKLLSKKRRR